jgi:pimeloyl-ACP methyl ester carboxylesterase
MKSDQIGGVPMPTIEVNGETIVYFKQGEGVPLVLLHGEGADGGLWSDMVDFLGKGYAAHAFSLRGHGGSTCNGGLSVDALTGDAKAAVAALGIAPFHLVGVSLGAAVALQFAAAAPDAVRSLTVSGIGLTSSKALADEIYGVREAVHYLTAEDFAQQVGETLLAPDAPEERLARIEQSLLVLTKQRYLQALEALAAVDLKMVASGIKPPVLVLRGELDEMVEAAAAEALAQAVGAAGCVEIPNAGHLANVDNPDVFAARLRTHIGST